MKSVDWSFPNIKISSNMLTHCWETCCEICVSSSANADLKWYVCSHWQEDLSNGIFAELPLHEFTKISHVSTNMIRNPSILRFKAEYLPAVWIYNNLSAAKSLEVHFPNIYHMKTKPFTSISWSFLLSDFWCYIWLEFCTE